MNQLAASCSPLTVQSLSGGVIVSTLSPFDPTGTLLAEAITDQTRRLAQIEGVTGIAVNTTVRERQSLTPAERLEVIRRTRAGLGADQLLLSCVGELSETVVEDVAACQAAGANAVITFPARWQKGYEGRSIDERMAALADLADRLPLPIVLALGNTQTRRPAQSSEIAQLVQYSRKVIGFEMGADDNVLHYDQDYYTLKAVDRPVACLAASEAALFHNLNTGGDGVLSCLAFIAPHEVAALYQASRADRFHEAQALHNKLSPLIGLLNGHDTSIRELIYRAIAHRMGTLASSDARGLTAELCPNLTAHLHKTLDDIRLKPISWV